MQVSQKNEDDQQLQPSWLQGIMQDVVFFLPKIADRRVLGDILRADGLDVSYLQLIPTGA